jgi:hypothetical protein
VIRGLVGFPRLTCGNAEDTLVLVDFVKRVLVPCTTGSSESWFSSWPVGRCSCLRVCASVSSSGLRSQSPAPRSQKAPRLPTPKVPKIRMTTAARPPAVFGSRRPVVPVGMTGRAHQRNQSVRLAAPPAVTPLIFSWSNTNIWPLFPSHSSAHCHSSGSPRKLKPSSLSTHPRRRPFYPSTCLSVPSSFNLVLMLRLQRRQPQADPWRVGIQS